MKKNGMTLVELLVVIGLLSVLLLLTLPNAIKAYKNSKRNNFATDAQTIFKTAVSQVQVDHPRRSDYIIYCRYKGEMCEGSNKFEMLELTGATDIDYFIVVDRKNAVEYFAVVNNDYQYAGGSVYTITHRLIGVDPVTGRNNYKPTSITKTIEGIEDFTIITADNVTDLSEVDTNNIIDIGHLAANYEEEVYGITNKTVPLGEMNERVFFLDINAVVDGVRYEKGAQIKKYMRSNVYFNGHLVAEEVDDYWAMQIAGTNYRVESWGINGYTCEGTEFGNAYGIISSPTNVNVICHK